MTLLVTGSQGFVGAAVCSPLALAGFSVRPEVCTAKPTAPFSNLMSPVVVDLEIDTDCSAALAGVTEVIHLAARVCVMDDKSPAPLVTYRQVNVTSTTLTARWPRRGCASLCSSAPSR